eukprot:CAMPEP_0182882542 /NCGR_PEP_ID=MMETSP0034_2-20130328/17848_1 /TAXON_ID=156128 /ORGANISM="Nephroselmis pyriformis, Strain CCMP717" /LENGTH=37 /DNA_ID= /DNA_START= /DNA_END= /DNA_ORIENTATION=
MSAPEAALDSMAAPGAEWRGPPGARDSITAPGAAYPP